MKTVLVIGRMDQLMKELNDFLKKYFRVQICADNLDSASGVMKVVEPDLVLISLVGFTKDEKKLFDTIEKNFPSMPVITIGTAQESGIFSAYYSGRQFENLTRPVENMELFKEICGRLHISEQETLAQAETARDWRKKVLVVDDNMSILRGIKGMLEDKYNVVLANSGMKAMTMIGKGRPDVILLDYEMPVVDGKQTLEMIRADEEIKDIPVIFLTGVNDKEHITAVLALNPARYLLKPASKEVLIDAIEKVFGNKK